MADFRNDDLEDILAGMLDEQDRRSGRQSSAAKPPELPRRELFLRGNINW